MSVVPTSPAAAGRSVLTLCITAQVGSHMQEERFLQAPVGSLGKQLMHRVEHRLQGLLRDDISGDEFKNPLRLMVGETWCPTPRLWPPSQSIHTTCGSRAGTAPSAELPFGWGPQPGRPFPPARPRDGSGRQSDLQLHPSSRQAGNNAPHVWGDRNPQGLLHGRFTPRRPSCSPLVSTAN